MIRERIGDCWKYESFRAIPIENFCFVLLIPKKSLPQLVWELEIFILTSCKNGFRWKIGSKEILT